MNNRQSGRRRGRNNNSNSNRPQSGGRGGVDQANRIDSRARGNGAQMIEKYRNLARDAQLAGDRVQTEYYLQFADHYFRVVSDFRARQEERAVQNGHDRLPDRQREIRGVEDFDGHDEGDADVDVEQQQPEADNAGEARAASRARRERDRDRDESEDRSPRQPRERAARRQRAPEPAPDAASDSAPAPVAAASKGGEGEEAPAGEAAPAPRRRGPRRVTRPAETEAEPEAAGIDSAVLPPAIGRTERPASDGGEGDDAAPPKPRRTRRTLAARATGVETAE